MKMGNKYHMVMTRDYLKKLILKDGAEEVLDGFKGSDKEAIKRIDASVLEYYTIGQCDNKDALGDCLGHTN